MLIMEEQKEHEHKEVVECKPRKNSFLCKVRNNPWMLSSIVLGVFVLILLISNFSGGMTGNVISETDAGEIILGFAEKQTGQVLEISEINDVSGIYEVIILYEGEEVPLYITKDGENLVSNLMPLSVLNSMATEQTQQQTQQTQSSYSEEDLKIIAETVECLAEKGVKIYGANWCGYTKAFVQALGGYEVIAPIYVECTEEVELCSQEEVRGYPTTKINGEAYSGSRDYEGLAQATGCAVPQIDIQASSATASCQ